MMAFVIGVVIVVGVLALQAMDDIHEELTEIRAVLTAEEERRREERRVTMGWKKESPHDE